MKEIDMNKKLKVIELFLAGATYDEITLQVGVSKGSVVNIIDEFRDGELPLPPGMTKYVDELRYVAVELKKRNTTVNQLKSYSKLHSKLKDMGVGDEQVETWLDICQCIATPAVPNKEFVAAAIQLGELKKNTGYDYQTLIQGYKAKLEAVKIFDGQIEQRKGELAKIEQKTKEQQEQATKELQAITKAITAAQETFAKQKAERESQLKEYMAQNELSWDKVNKVLAVIHSELKKVGLSQDEEGAISKEIAKVGSLTVLRENLEKQKKELESDCAQLSQQQKELTGYVNGLTGIYRKLSGEILGQTNQRSELNTRLKTKKAELSQFEKVASTCAADLYACQLILGFLTAPDLLNNYNFDQLTRLILALREIRLGGAPMRVTDAEGNIVCQCPVPTQYIPLNQYGVNVDQAREKLALYLVPLVQDKFVSKLEYDAAQVSLAISETNKILLDLELKKAGPSASGKESK